MRESRWLRRSRSNSRYIELTKAQHLRGYRPEFAAPYFFRQILCAIQLYDGLVMRRVKPTRYLQRKPLPRRYDAFFVLILAGFALLFGLFVHIKRWANPTQHCPIDGQAAEWRTEGYRDHHICNYGHFSKVDQKSHTWWASCV